MRKISHRYVDPLDGIWIAAAHGMGIRVVRSAESYASYDGQGTLSLSDAKGMDPDDCLAQMILHEICHALVQGPPSFGWVDWGLDNISSNDEKKEHACLRLQAALLSPWGLRKVLAPTTGFRAYYDELDDDPFLERDPSERESIVRARAAYARRSRRPVGEHLTQALQRTSHLLWELRSGGPPPADDCLLSTVELPHPPHPSGLPRTRKPTHCCAECAWSQPLPNGELGCRKAEDRLVLATEPACDHFELPFDCLGCGACCREAYDTVEVEHNDPAVRHHLPLLEPRSGGYDVQREGARCACLRGGDELAPPRPTILGGREPPDAGERVAPRFMPSDEAFTCAIYPTRPQTCRDFSIFSEHCLSARRTVGLSC